NREARKVFEAALVKVTAQDPIGSIIQETSSELAKIGNAVTGVDFSTAGEAAMEVIATIDDSDDQIHTGFPEVDNLTYGIRPCAFRGIGARPGEGKTAYGLSELCYVGGFRSGQKTCAEDARRV